MSFVNQDQILSIIRWILAIAGPSILASGWVSGSTWEQLVALAPTFAGLIWGLFAHTNSSKVKAAATVPGARVLISPNAAPELRKMASNPNIPDIVSA